MLGEGKRVQWRPLGLGEVHRPEDHAPEVGVEPRVPLPFLLEQPLVDRASERPEREAPVLDQRLDLGRQHPDGPGDKHSVHSPAEVRPTLERIGRQCPQQPHRTTRLHPISGVPQDLWVRFDNSHSSIRSEHAIEQRGEVPTLGAEQEDVLPLPNLEVVQ